MLCVWQSGKYPYVAHNVLYLEEEEEEAQLCYRYTAVSLVLRLWHDCSLQTLRKDHTHNTTTQHLIQHNTPSFNASPTSPEPLLLCNTHHHPAACAHLHMHHTADLRACAPQCLYALACVHKCNMHSTPTSSRYHHSHTSDLHPTDFLCRYMQIPSTSYVHHHIC